MKEEMTMKKMITNMKALAALLMVGAAVTSCSSDDSIIGEPDAPQVYTMTVEASKGTNGTRTLTDEGTTLTSTWSVGDKVEVWTADGTTKKYGELTAQTAGASTTLSGTLSSLPNNDETLTLKYLSPDYDTQDGTLTGSAKSIDKVCDYATATVTATVNGSSVTTPNASFVNQQAVVKFTLKDNAATPNAISPTALTVSDGTHTVSLTIPATTYTTNGDGVVYVAIPGFSGKTVSLSATVGSDIYTYDRASVTFENGNFYRITVKMKEIPVLNGKFSVGESKQVVFSIGNLQATTADLGENWTWAFAAHQWDYVGNNAANNAITGNKTVSTNGTVDLFGWSTSKTYFGIHNSHYNDDYSEDFYDWGNVPGIGSGWRTLSQDEWIYLFNTRTNAAAKYGYATVNDKHGIIILPDEFTDPMKNNGAYAFRVSSIDEWNANVYTSANWAYMEANGAVFLPAAGYRYENGVELVGSWGFYWSSTVYIESEVYSVHFDEGHMYTDTHSARPFGCFVRLVRDVVVAP